MSDKYCDEEEENGRVETLVKTIDRIELLEKMLEIALAALTFYNKRSNWYGDNHELFLDDGYKYAEEALEKIYNVQSKQQ